MRLHIDNGKGLRMIFRNTSPPRSFNGRLRHAAAVRQLRQVDIARMCNVTRATVSAWFNGVVPSGVNLTRLAGILAVHQEWLLSFDKGPAQRAALAAEVSRRVAYDVTRNAAAVPLLPHQVVTDRALMDIYKELERLAQDWLALPERDRVKWARLLQREAAKHRADGTDDPSAPLVDLSFTRQKKNSARPRPSIGNGTKRRNAKKPDGT